MVNTRITYEYRDGANYRFHTDLVVAGIMSDALWARIRAACEEREKFIAHQVGLPEVFGFLPGDHIYTPEYTHSGYPYDTDVDHCWHRFGADPDAWLLNEAVESAGRRRIDVKADPRIVVWGEAHRRFGSNPNKFPPAHFSLIKRVQKPGIQLAFINKVVTIMNYNSIADVIPVGGDDLDHAGPCLELRYASGQETFVPLDSPQTSEHPTPG